MQKLYKGDCMEVLKELPATSVNLVLCDLPYGTTDAAWDKNIPLGPLWQQYSRVLKPNGVVALFASGAFMPQLLLSNVKEFKYKWTWIRSNATNFIHAKNRPMNKHEDILIFSPAPMGHASLLGARRMKYNPQGLIEVNAVKKEGAKLGGDILGSRPSHKLPGQEYIQKFTNYPNDVLNYKSAAKRLHMSEKPVDLLEFLIKSYTDAGDLVLDNCMGVGSTGVAALRSGRDFIGIEINADYYKVACERCGYSDKVDA